MMTSRPFKVALSLITLLWWKEFITNNKQISYYMVFRFKLNTPNMVGLVQSMVKALLLIYISDFHLNLFLRVRHT